MTAIALLGIWIVVGLVAAVVFGFLAHPWSDQ